MLYLAMTAAELAHCATLPPHVAWLSCRFSARNPGISNIPQALPKGSVIILSDETPISGHDPKTVEHQLQELIHRLQPEAVLLDFQRPGGQDMAAHLTKSLPIPTGVSEMYAAPLTCPVFLSPTPLCRPFTNRWSGRELWLDLPICNQTVTVTKNGPEISDFLPYQPLEDGFFHERLAVRYKLRCFKDRAEFTLSRGLPQIENWKLPEVSHFFCLYQETP